MTLFLVASDIEVHDWPKSCVSGFVLLNPPQIINTPENLGLLYFPNIYTIEGVDDQVRSTVQVSTYLKLAMKGFVKSENHTARSQ